MIWLKQLSWESPMRALKGDLLVAEMADVRPRLSEAERACLAEPYRSLSQDELSVQVMAVAATRRRG